MGVKTGADRGGLPPAPCHYLPHLFRSPWKKSGVRKFPLDHRYFPTIYSFKELCKLRPLLGGGGARIEEGWRHHTGCVGPLVVLGRVVAPNRGPVLRLSLLLLCHSSRQMIRVCQFWMAQRADDGPVRRWRTVCTFRERLGLWSP